MEKTIKPRTLMELATSEAELLDENTLQYDALAAAEDKAGHLAVIIELIAQKLGVEIEPHQSFEERLLGAVENRNTVLGTVHNLLNSYFWLDTLDTMEMYQRYQDDHPEEHISVSFGSDSDAHLSIFSVTKQAWPSVRFRVMQGGGQSRRVRNALIILAEAIRLDNEERPQHR